MTKRINSFQSTAEGHTATIMKYDDETVFVPLKWHECWILIGSFQNTYDILVASKDFPEEKEYKATLDNLKTALGMLNIVTSS